MVYTQPGLYDASLTVFNGGVSKSITKNNILRVYSTTADTVTESFIESFENQLYLDNKWLFVDDFGGGMFEVTSDASVSGTKSLFLIT